MTDKKKDPSKDLEKVIDKMKGSMNASEEQVERLKNMAENYKGKSQEEVFMEIINLNKQLSKGGKSDDFQKKLKKLEQLRPLLSEEQNKKLDMIMKLLKESQE